MYRFLFALTLIVITALVSFSQAQPPPPPPAPASSAQAPQRDPSQEQPFIDELRKTADENTVAKFVSATEALDSRQLEEAEKLFKEVLTKAPDFEPALRRLGYTYVALGRREDGLEMTARALAKNRSVENLIGRVNTLLSSDDLNHRPSQSMLSTALPLAKEAWEKSGYSDESGAYVAEILLMSERRMDEFKQFAPTYKAKFPDSPAAAYYYAIALAENGDLDAAEAEIGRARELGGSNEALLPLLTAINDARDEAFFGLGRYRGYLYVAFGLVGLWAVGLVALFIIGRTLSKKTLRSIEESDPNDITGQAQASLKKFYRRIVAIAGVYYYISQPFVIFLVVVFTVSVVFSFLWVGRIPIGFVIGIVFVGAASIFYIVKSLVTRVKVEDPGRALTEVEASGLWRLARDVAKTIDTRPVDEIRITPGSDLAVYERGSFRAKISGQADRILIVGTAVLNGFDQNAFRAVLAHEYGHFSNKDTAGGDIAFRVNTDIARIAESMVASETNTIFNLGFHFLRLFHFIFRRITHGASRLQEVLADRVAAYHYGPDAFKEGLRHVVRREIEFQRVADNEIGAALGANRAIQNVYEITVNEESTQKQIDDEVVGLIERPTTDDDTHPSPADRFRYVGSIRPSEAEHLHGEVWELFADRTSITTEMSDIIEKLVRPDWRSEGSTLGI